MGYASLVNNNKSHIAHRALTLSCKTARDGSKEPPGLGVISLSQNYNKTLPADGW